MRGTRKCSEHLRPHPIPLPLGEGQGEGVACDLGRADTREVVLTRDLLLPRLMSGEIAV